MNGTRRSDPERQQFEKELLELQPFLKAFARSLTGNQDSAEDLAQEVNIKAVQSYSSFIPGTNLKAWLFTILRNQFYSDRRRAWRQAPWDEEAAMRIPDERWNTAEAAYDWQRVLWYMAFLTEEQRDALIAVGHLGMEYEEAALPLQCAVGTVKSRVARARMELKRLIDEEHLVGRVDLTYFQTRANGMSSRDPFYPIAKAYEELYAPVSGEVRNVNEEQTHTPALQKGPAKQPSEVDALWTQLCRSGALEEPDDIPDFLR